jgi:hypothetical protein
MQGAFHDAAKYKKTTTPRKLGITRIIASVCAGWLDCFEDWHFFGKEGLRLAGWSFLSREKKQKDKFHPLTLLLFASLPPQS